MALDHLMEAKGLLEEAAMRLKTKPDRLLDGLDALALKMKVMEKDLMQLQEKTLAQDVDDIVKKGRRVKDVLVVEHQFKNADIGLLRRCVDLLKVKLPSAGVFFLSGRKDDDVYFVCGLTQDMTQKGKGADQLLKTTLTSFGGSGGGRRDFAQGGLKDVSKTDAVFKEFGRLLEEVL
jgi:alanyl-tRNA synthetase